MSEIVFKKHTVEYYDWYDIQDFLETESGIGSVNFTDWILGDYNNDAMIGIDIGENIIDLTENANKYTKDCLGDCAPKLAEALAKLKIIVGNDIIVQISW